MYRRAISNFVSILAGKKYPVKFYKQGTSCTDGKTVIISSDIQNEGLDKGVGLALHEASHLLLTDFDIFKSLLNGNHIPWYILDKGQKLGFDQFSIIEEIKLYWNYVEDRYIDDYIYTNVPGYRGYYDALYESEWNSDSISEGLESDVYREPSLKAYRFRIINLTNPKTDLSALPDLDKIKDLLDLPNISRLTHCMDRVRVGCEILKIVFDNLSEANAEKKKYFSVTSEEFETTAIAYDEEWPDKFSMPEEESGSSQQDPEEEGESSDEEDIGSELEEAINKQKRFLNGNIEMTELSEDDESNLDALESSKVEIKTVGNKKSKCIIINRLNKDLIQSEYFPLSKNGLEYSMSKQGLESGIRMGKVLAKTLKIRNEARTTIFNRQKKGKIDQRMVSTLGFDNEEIFYSKEVDIFIDSFLHVSVDASSSMEGDKWKQALASAVAIAYSATQIQNLDVVISFRTSYKHHPYVVIGYDSREDKFSKIKSLFLYLWPDGLTPEGLCFEAILDKIPISSSQLNSYFLNFSDGMPIFPQLGYQNLVAWIHTRQQIQILEKNGVDILSYFITDSEFDSSTKPSFELMYGSHARFVDINDVRAVAKTMNNKFIKKT